MFPIDSSVLPTLHTRRALLCIDLQADFLSASGALPLSEPGDLVARTTDLASKFRESGSGDVVWIRSEFDQARRADVDRIVISDTPQLKFRSSSSSSASSSSTRGRRGAPQPPERVDGDPEAFLSVAPPPPPQQVQHQRKGKGKGSGGASGGKHGAEGNRGGSWKDPAQASKPECVRPGTPGSQLAPLIAAAVDSRRDCTLTKTHYSAFESGQLLRLLRGRLATELLICGALTNVSIYATALDAARHGFDITIVDDCCGFRSSVRHLNALRKLVHLTGCTLQPSDQIIAGLKVSKPISTSDRITPPRGRGPRESVSEDIGRAHAVEPPLVRDSQATDTSTAKEKSHIPAQDRLAQSEVERESENTDTDNTVLDSMLENLTLSSDPAAEVSKSTRHGTAASSAEPTEQDAATAVATIKPTTTTTTTTKTLKHDTPSPAPASPATQSRADTPVSTSPELKKGSTTSEKGYPARRVVSPPQAPTQGDDEVLEAGSNNSADEDDDMKDPLALLQQLRATNRMSTRRYVGADLPKYARQRRFPPVTAGVDPTTASGAGSPKHSKTATRSPKGASGGDKQKPVETIAPAGGNETKVESRLRSDKGDDTWKSDNGETGQGKGAQPQPQPQPASGIEAELQKALESLELKKKISPGSSPSPSLPSSSALGASSRANIAAKPLKPSPTMEESGEPAKPSMSEPLCEGDMHIVYDVLPPSLEAGIFERVRDEVAWARMSHQGGEVPRLVAVQGTIGPDGTQPVYRHPADESPPLLPFTPSVLEIKAVVERAAGHELNHVLIQFYRDGNDYISEHSDKTLDIVAGSYINNVSLGAERTMVLRTKRADNKNSSKGALSAKSHDGQTQVDDDGDEAAIAESTKRVKTKTGGETTLKRRVERARLPHNSLYRMGLRTNMRWMHAIRQDKRAARDKDAAELAFGGARISLTFRRIGTFLDRSSSRIWGQGAVAKSGPSGSRPVRNGQSNEAIAMLRAFGAENHASNFDWQTHYGGGFDVLHMTASPRFFACGDRVADLGVRLMLAWCGIQYARGSVVSGGGSTSTPAAVKPTATSQEGPSSGVEDDTQEVVEQFEPRRAAKFIDNDPDRATIQGDVAILMYLDAVYLQKKNEQEQALNISSSTSPSAANIPSPPPANSSRHEHLAKQLTCFQQAVDLRQAWRSASRAVDGTRKEEKKKVAPQPLIPLPLRRELAAWEDFAKDAKAEKEKHCTSFKVERGTDFYSAPFFIGGGPHASLADFALWPVLHDIATRKEEDEEAKPGRSRTEEGVDPVPDHHPRAASPTPEEDGKNSSTSSSGGVFRKLGLNNLASYYAAWAATEPARSALGSEAVPASPALSDAREGSTGVAAGAGRGTAAAAAAAAEQAQ